MQYHQDITPALSHVMCVKSVKYNALDIPVKEP